MKKRFTHKPVPKKQAFWEEEYKQAGHLAMSQNPSEDLQKFMRWLERTYKDGETISIRYAADLGCGNGRNSKFLSSEYGIHATGFDYSLEAIQTAQQINEDYPRNNFFLHSLHDMPYPIDDESCDLVLDMMASHILNSVERKNHKAEVMRILKPGGWFFFKTFLLDEDLHARRLIKDHPGPEENSYIHPEMQIAEFVLSEQDIIAELQEAGFEVLKAVKSHKHMIDGHAAKRRSVSLYVNKPY